MAYVWVFVPMDGSSLASPGTLLLVLLTTVPFYFSTAEEFHTKMMYFGVINGPVEGVLIGIGLMIVSGTYGGTISDFGRFLSHQLTTISKGTALWKLPLATFFPSLGLPSWMITTDLMLFPMLALMLFFHVPLWYVLLNPSNPLRKR